MRSKGRDGCLFLIDVHVRAVGAVGFARRCGVAILCRVITCAQSTSGVCFACGLGMTKTLAFEALDGARVFFERSVVLISLL